MAPFAYKTDKPGIKPSSLVDQSAPALFDDYAVAVNFRFHEAAASNDNLRTADPDTSTPTRVTMVPAAVAPTGVTRPGALVVPTVVMTAVPASLPSLPGFCCRSEGSGCNQHRDRANDKSLHEGLPVH